MTPDESRAYVKGQREMRERAAHLMAERRKQYFDHLFGREHITDAQCVECERITEHATAIFTLPIDETVSMLFDPSNPRVENIVRYIETIGKQHPHTQELAQHIVTNIRAVFASATPSPAPPASASDGEPRRCLITGHPCGTDTWIKNHPCACSECQAWLCEQAAALRRQVGDAEEALRKYGVHIDTCSRWSYWNAGDVGSRSLSTERACDCGFDAALAALRGSGASANEPRDDVVPRDAR